MKKFINEALGKLSSSFSESGTQLLHGNICVEGFTEWEIVDSPKRLIKDFSFDDVTQLKFFLNEIIEHQNEINHHAKITLDGNNIRVEATTHDLDDITELDSELAHEVDLIYRDACDAY
tara:strand:- start:6 stop:362 length:357 start_codon:yes stop_codon:yes gene_type:complete